MVITGGLHLLRGKKIIPTFDKTFENLSNRKVTRRSFRKKVFAPPPPPKQIPLTPQQKPPNHNDYQNVLSTLNNQTAYS